MKQLFLFGLLILHGGFAAAQEVYGPDHKGMNNALWNDDSERIATWGWSPYVYVWRDSDGLLLLELDHRPIMTWSPGQNFVASNASISDLHWSEDGELIITRAHTRRPDNYVHGLNSNLHKLIEDENLVFTWAYDRLALVDINPKSETIGEVLSEIDFGDRAIVSLIWSEDALTALLKLRDDGKRYCDTCPTSFKLVDTDLSSEPFGQTLWQTMTPAGAQAYLWHDATDPLAIYSEGQIELWDLNRASAGFGKSLLRIDLEYKWFHSVLLGTDNRRLIVIEQSNMDYVEGAHPDAGPRCHDKNCQYHIGIWDIDPQSAHFGERMVYIVHQYPENDHSNRVQFNTSATQLHIKTFALISREPTWEWEEELSAYDPRNGQKVEPQDTVPEPENTSQRRRYFLDIDLSHIGEDFLPIAVNPAGTKVMASNCEEFPSPCLYFIFDLQTGEWLLPRLIG